MLQQLINDEKFTNVQRAQAGLTRLFQNAAKTKSFYRVLKNDQPLGVLIPNSMWESFIEDLEMLSSPAYLRRIAATRVEKGGLTLMELKKKYKVT